MINQIIFLIPVYNDWDAVNHLIKNIAALLNQHQSIEASFYLINDGSTEQPGYQFSSPYNIHIIHLQLNLGHQKALAIGLAYIQQHVNCNNVVVMDGDGEDRPEEVLNLLQASNLSDKIVLAQRKARKENLEYQFFYFLYKLLFKTLTGKTIAYGNFMVLPKWALDKIVYYSEIWSNLPGAILKSGLPYTPVATQKGLRYAGQSKMNFNALFLHGLGAISVFIDLIVSRLLLFSVILILLSLIGGVLILAIRFFTDLAIPGWASTLLSLMLVVLLQGFLLSLFTLFLYFSSQSQRKFIPAHHYNDYIRQIEKVNE
jgi:polyisoprenyl-phosphate glycosyltransferase